MAGIRKNPCEMGVKSLRACAPARLLRMPSQLKKSPCVQARACARTHSRGLFSSIIFARMPIWAGKTGDHQRKCVMHAPARKLASKVPFLACVRAC